LLRSEGGELRIGETRAVLLTESAFVFLQRVIHEQMPELLKAGFYDMGYRAGLDLARTAEGLAAEPEEAFRHMVETYQQAGFGKIEVLEFDLAQPVARLRGTNLIESAAAEQSGIYLTPRAVDPLHARHLRRALLAAARPGGDLRGGRLHLPWRRGLRVHRPAFGGGE